MGSCEDYLGIPKIEPPKMTPITTLRKLGDYGEVPFFGSFRGSGNYVRIIWGLCEGYIGIILGSCEGYVMIP